MDTSKHISISILTYHYGPCGDRLEEERPSGDLGWPNILEVSCRMERISWLTLRILVSHCGCHPQLIHRMFKSDE